MKLIDKDALVVEIERRRNDYINSFMTEQVYMLNNVLDFLDTLEVKEVDLNEEIEKCLKRHSMLAVGKKDFTDLAKHFFELGMKTSNPLTWEDIAYIEDITSTILAECKDKILYDTQESLFKEILKRFKAQKGEKV